MNSNLSSELMQRFSYFDRANKGYLTSDELRAFVFNLYNENPPKGSVDALDEHLFLSGMNQYNPSQTMQVINMVRSKERSAPAPAPAPTAPSFASSLSFVPVPPTSSFAAPSLAITPFGSVPMQQQQAMVPYSQPQQQQQQMQQQPNFFAPPMQTTTSTTTTSYPSTTQSAPQFNIASVAAAAGGLPSAVRSQTGRPPLARGSSSGSSSNHDGHYISKEEQRAFCAYLNTHPILSQDRDLVGTILPLKPDSDDLYRAVSSGVLFCKFLNASRAGTVPLNQIKLHPSSIFECSENQALAIAGAQKLGCSVVNIGPQDLIEGKAHLVLGMIWQMIRFDLLSKITVQNHPELCNLLTKGNSSTGEQELTLQQMNSIAPEQVLLHWMNHHLRSAGYNKPVSNFSSDIKDGAAYTVLLNKLAPNLVSLDGLRDPDTGRRCQTVCDAASRLGCNKFVTANDIMTGNSRLNLAFVADLFNSHPGIALPSMDDLERLRKQNAEMASVIAETEARLRQLAMDRQLAEELQNLEILEARQREADRQRELIEGEAFALAEQRKEEQMLEQENIRRRQDSQRSEAYLANETRSQQHDRKIVAPQPQPQRATMPTRTDYPSFSSSSKPSTTTTTSYSSKSSAPSRPLGSYAVYGSNNYSTGTKSGIFERAGHKIDKKLRQVKDVRKYN